MRKNAEKAKKNHRNKATRETHTRSVKHFRWSQFDRFLNKFLFDLPSVFIFSLYFFLFSFLLPPVSFLSLYIFVAQNILFVRFLPLHTTYVTVKEDLHSYILAVSELVVVVVITTFAQKDAEWNICGWNGNGVQASSQPTAVVYWVVGTFILMCDSHLTKHGINETETEWMGANMRPSYIFHYQRKMLLYLRQLRLLLLLLLDSVYCSNKMATETHL